jgi:hypothetical protein
MFDILASSIEQIRAGTVRALAVTTATRSEALPDIPSVGEFVRAYEANSVYGLGAPKAAAEIVDRLNKEMRSGTQTMRAVSVDRRRPQDRRRLGAPRHGRAAGPYDGGGFEFRALNA